MIIELPKIGDVEGAIYDSEKERFEQSEECHRWGVLVRFSVPINEGKSIKEVYRERVRYSRQIHTYEGINLVIDRDFGDSPIESNTYNVCEVSIKIEQDGE